MAILDGDDCRRLANWYRDELTFLRWFGEAVADHDWRRAHELINERRDVVGAQIKVLADAVGVETGRSK